MNQLVDRTCSLYMRCEQLPLGSVRYCVSETETPTPCLFLTNNFARLCKAHINRQFRSVRFQSFGLRQHVLYEIKTRLNAPSALLLVCATAGRNLSGVSPGQDVTVAVMSVIMTRRCSGLLSTPRVIQDQHVLDAQQQPARHFSVRQYAVSRLMRRSSSGDTFQ